MAVLLPAIQQARSAARRVECQNNLRQIGIAVTSFTTVHERFPATAYYNAQGDTQGNWVISLLPHLDAAAIQRQWQFDKPFSHPANQFAQSTSLSVLTCPVDFTAEPGKGNLSYGANGGIGWTEPSDCPVSLHVNGSPQYQPLDLNGNGISCPSRGMSDGSPTDREIFKSMGLFFVENWPIGQGTVRHHRPENVLDGLSNTIAIAETVRGGYDPTTGDSWASPHPLRNSFFLSSYICPNNSCAPGTVDFSRANNHTQSPYRDEAINSAIDQPEGEAPWPSSLHNDGVNVLFGDGSVRFVGASQDSTALASNITPAGMNLPLHMKDPY